MAKPKNMAIDETPAILLFVLLLGFVFPVAAQSHWQVDLESGLAISGYNKVRIPGSTGTKFSISRDLDVDQTVFWRARISRMFDDKHSLSLLISPLTFNAEGRLEKDFKFAGDDYATQTFLKAKYRFDS